MFQYRVTIRFGVPRQQYHVMDLTANSLREAMRMAAFVSRVQGRPAREWLAAFAKFGVGGSLILLAHHGQLCACATVEEAGSTPPGFLVGEERAQQLVIGTEWAPTGRRRRGTR